MHCPDLINIFNLIRYYSEYGTDADIARRLQIDRSNIRNYLYDHANAPYIPAKRHQDFQSLFSEILSEQVSLDRTRALLAGDADTFHSLISPISGRSWARLIDASLDQTRLLVRKKSSPTLGFGTSTQIHRRAADLELKVGDEFELEATVSIHGEAVIFAETAGMWYIIPPNADNSTFLVTGKAHLFPPQTDTGRCYLVEGGPIGFYRYYFVGVRGKFSRALRDHLKAANPLTQAKLDIIADLILSNEAPWVVSGATLRVTN